METPRGVYQAGHNGPLAGWPPPSAACGHAQVLSYPGGYPGGYAHGVRVSPRPTLAFPAAIASPLPSFWPGGAPPILTASLELPPAPSLNKAAAAMGAYALSAYATPALGRDASAYAPGGYAGGCAGGPAGGPEGERSSLARAGVAKRAWLPEEDALLLRIVGQLGPHRWSAVASFVPGRIGKQCRERWFNHLSSSVKKGPWTAEEDAAIAAAVEAHGTHWSQIAKGLAGRTDNAIKNRYNSAIRKTKRHTARAPAPRLRHAHSAGASATESGSHGGGAAPSAAACAAPPAAAACGAAARELGAPGFHPPVQASLLPSSSQSGTEGVFLSGCGPHGTFVGCSFGAGSGSAGGNGDGNGGAGGAYPCSGMPQGACFASYFADGGFGAGAGAPGGGEHSEGARAPLEAGQTAAGAHGAVQLRALPGPALGPGAALARPGAGFPELTDSAAAARDMLRTLERGFAHAGGPPPPPAAPSGAGPPTGRARPPVQLSALWLPRQEGRAVAPGAAGGDVAFSTLSTLSPLQRDGAAAGGATPGSLADLSPLLTPSHLGDFLIDAF